LVAVDARTKLDNETNRQILATTERGGEQRRRAVVLHGVDVGTEADEHSTQIRMRMQRGQIERRDTVGVALVHIANGAVAEKRPHRRFVVGLGCIDEPIHFNAPRRRWHIRCHIVLLAAATFVALCRR
jgi:hypothetical protein